MTVELKESEKVILEKMSEGANYDVCADELGYARGTVRNLAHRLFEKIGADNMTHAVAIGFRHGWLK